MAFAVEKAVHLVPKAYKDGKSEIPEDVQEALNKLRAPFSLTKGELAENIAATKIPAHKLIDRHMWVKGEK
jgi:hypothetical protein